jgi:hypothetical protein
MKEIATYMGGAGKYIAAIYEGNDGGVTFYQVNYGPQSNLHAFSKVFMTEEAASNFAAGYISKGDEPTLLNE